jgi:hypothetical protein
VSQGWKRQGWHYISTYEVSSFKLTFKFGFITYWLLRLLRGKTTMSELNAENTVKRRSSELFKPLNDGVSPAAPAAPDDAGL